MISNFIFYLNNWGIANIIHKMQGPNLCPSNVGEVIILQHHCIPRHFIVKERIIDYNEHTIHYKVEMVADFNIKG